MLFDSETLTPQAVLDGAALTSLRTPAMSALAARHLAPHDASRLVVFGTGEQALGHVNALREVRPIKDVRVIGRNEEKTRRFALSFESDEFSVAPGSVYDVAAADVVVCATTSSSPLFDSALVADSTMVIAVGTHEPTARELDGTLMGRARVVVEDIETALHEAGEIIQAIDEQHLRIDAVENISTVVRSQSTPDDRPRVFKGVGMGWQDLVVAGLAAGHLSDATRLPRVQRAIAADNSRAK